MFHNFSCNYVDFYEKDSVKYLLLNNTSNRNNIQGVKVNIVKINTLLPPNFGHLGNIFKKPNILL